MSRKLVSIRGIMFSSYANMLVFCIATEHNVEVS